MGRAPLHGSAPPSSSAGGVGVDAREAARPPPARAAHTRTHPARRIWRCRSLPPQDYTIVELPRHGAKVGIVGLTTTDTSFTSSPGALAGGSRWLVAPAAPLLWAAAGEVAVGGWHHGTLRRPAGALPRPPPTPPLSCRQIGLQGATSCSAITLMPCPAAWRLPRQRAPSASLPSRTSVLTRTSRWLPMPQPPAST